MEIILVLIVTALVFGLFFLVFFIKGTAKDRPARFHTCGKCNCQGGESRADPLTHQAPAAKEQPCRSTGAGES